jgi:hypothetical protein
MHSLPTYVHRIHFHSSHLSPLRYKGTNGTYTKTWTNEFHFLSYRSNRIFKFELTEDLITDPIKVKITLECLRYGVNKTSQRGVRNTSLSYCGGSRGQISARRRTILTGFSQSSSVLPYKCWNGTLLHNYQFTAH